MDSNSQKDVENRSMAVSADTERVGAGDGHATVLVTGYAPAPKGTAMNTVYQCAGVVLEVDPVTNTIVRADITALTDLAKSFFHKLLVGQSVEDAEMLAGLMRQRYIAPSVEALIMALRSAVQRYAEHKRVQEGGVVRERPRLKLKSVGA